MITTILGAFLEHLDDFVYSPQPVILWPGLQSNPPESGMWLQSNFFPNEPIDRVWGYETCVEARGFFQVSVHFRVNPGTGQLAPSLLADAIIDHFPKGLVLGPVRVRKRAWQSPAIVQDASRSFIPVTIPYWGMIDAASSVVAHEGIIVTHTP